MVAAFQLRNPDTGRTLIDTSYTRLGLVKSGYMSGLPVEDYSFTVDAICPIVFIVGAAVLSYSTRSGNSWEFRYRGWPAVPSYTDVLEPPVPGRTASTMPVPRYYVFDLMRDNKSGRGLWIRNPQTLQTVFNSDQPPMNVRAAIVPPGPPSGDVGAFQSPAGVWMRRMFPNGGWDNAPGLAQQVALPVSALGLDMGRQWAWFSPWRRGAQYSGSAEDYTVLEAVAALDGYVGWGWLLDPQTTWSVQPGFGQGVYSPNANSPTICLMDTTDLPFPFSY